MRNVPHSQVFEHLSLVGVAVGEVSWEVQPLLEEVCHLGVRGFFLCFMLLAQEPSFQLPVPATMTASTPPSWTLTTLEP